MNSLRTSAHWDSCRSSGRYPLHTGINNWLPNEAVGLPLDEVTLADLLKEHGYSTHAIGYVLWCYCHSHPVAAHRAHNQSQYATAV
eukprot:COSAG02_NODE_1755_length_11052_cov_67.877842_2_plen_86_part_00